MLKNLLAWGTVFLSLALMAACHESSADPDGKSTPLIGPIESYQSVDVFSSSIPSDVKWERLGNAEKEPSIGARPPYDVTSILIHEYSDLAHEGLLDVTFFNDRLAETRFYPHDFDGYVAALSKQVGSEFSVHKEAFLEPRTRVWIATDYRGRKYIGWQDKSLADEMNGWIKKYA